MPDHPIDLSVVVPCWNEAPHLRASYEALQATLGDLRWDVEIVFVDDASTDATPEVLRSIAASDPRVRIVTHPWNRGRGAAVKSGFSATRGRIIGFIDIDLEIGAHYIAPCVAAIARDGADVAIGVRSSSVSNVRQIGRFVISRAYTTLQQAALGLGLSDTETGCKFFRRETCEHVIEQTRDERWFWDTEVVARAVLANLVVREVPVVFERSTKPSTVRLLRDSWRQLVALRVFRREVGLARAAQSPIYWSPAIYDRGMDLLCGPYDEAVLREVAENIPPGASVVDVCCGSGRLGRELLVPRGCPYIGLDFNAHFIRDGQRRGLDLRQFVVGRDAIPVADYVVLCSSLYHFAQQADDLIEQLRASARVAVIISEPVTRLLGSVLDSVRGLITSPGIGDASYRYTLESFTALGQQHGATALTHADHRHNAIAIFPGLANRATASVTRLVSR